MKIYRDIDFTLDDSIVVIDDLSKGGQAVGCAGGVGDHSKTLVILLVIDAHHEHRGVSGGGGDDDLLGSSLVVSSGLLQSGEHSGGLHNVLGPDRAPGDGGGIPLTEDGDGVTVNHQLPVHCRHLSLVLTVGGVVPNNQSYDTDLTAQ